MTATRLHTQSFYNKESPPHVHICVRCVLHINANNEYNKGNLNPPYDIENQNQINNNNQNFNNFNYQNPTNTTNYDFPSKYRMRNNQYNYNFFEHDVNLRAKNQSRYLSNEDLLTTNRELLTTMQNYNLPEINEDLNSNPEINYLTRSLNYNDNNMKNFFPKSANLSKSQNLIFDKVNNFPEGNLENFQKNFLNSQSASNINKNNYLKTRELEGLKPS